MPYSRSSQSRIRKSDTPTHAGNKTTFHVGDLVLVRVIHVNRTQLNAGGAFANRWEGPYKVIEQVPHQSYRLELPVRASSRMGRVFNAIEPKPYQLRNPEDAERILRGALRDKLNRDDIPDPNAPDVIDLDNTAPPPNAALPRWQQRMEAVEGAPVEPGLDDIRPVVADAPSSQSRAPVPVAGRACSSTDPVPGLADVSQPSSQDIRDAEFERLLLEELKRTDIDAYNSALRHHRATERTRDRDTAFPPAPSGPSTSTRAASAQPRYNLRSSNRDDQLHNL